MSAPLEPDTAAWNIDTAAVRAAHGDVERCTCSRCKDVYRLADALDAARAALVAVSDLCDAEDGGGAHDPDYHPGIDICLLRPILDPWANPDPSPGQDPSLNPGPETVPPCERCGSTQLITKMRSRICAGCRVVREYR